MINWLDNPQANYVLAAYGLALVCLIGLLVSSWCASRKSNAAWRAIQARRKAPIGDEPL